MNSTFFKSKEEKKKAISPIISAILLLVIAIGLVLIILSWGKGFTGESTEKSKQIDFKKSDYVHFVYPKGIKGDSLEFTYNAPSNLSSEVTITHYRIIDKIDMNYVELDPPKTLNSGLNYLELPCLYEHYTSQVKMVIELITDENTYITINQNEQKMVCIPGGTGTENDPIIICGAEDLNNIRNDVNASYILGKDIDLSCYLAEDENGWLPIGTTESPFQGNLNGNNKKITGLYINRPTTDNIGLFGAIRNFASIHDLILEDIEVIGQDNVGGVIGKIVNTGSNRTYYVSTGVYNIQVTGQINGRNYIGGFYGFGTDSYTEGLFFNNSFIGEVYGNNYVGGFLGYAKGIYRNNFSGGTVTGNDYVGGFGNFNGGTIENSYSTSNVNGNNNIGGFLGYSNRGKYFNNYATGDVNGNEYIGGFTGESGYGQYYSNHSTGDANGNNYVGGFIGHHDGGKLFNNYSMGNAYGIGNYVGGFVGEISYGKFYYNFSIGDVSGLDYLGGFTGSNGGTIINNYSKGNITRLSGEGTNIGGFTGNNSNNLLNNYSVGKIIYDGTDNPTDKGFAGSDSGGCLYGNNYWDINTSEQETSAGDAEGKTTLEMKSIPDENIFVDWDFVGIWRRDVSGTINGGYPYFDWQSTIKTGAIVSDFCDEELLLDSQNRYIIDTPGKLNCIRNNLSGDYVLGADIDLDVSPYNGGEGFEPIGIAFDSGQDFFGSLDGAGYTISNLYINRPTTDYVGLFGSTVNATINNLNLENVNISGDYAVGGIVGYSRFGSISNSSISGNILGTRDVGGLIGDNQSPINNSYSSGSVSGTGNSIGGLVGSNSGLINNSHSSSVVSGINFVGGLIGYNSRNNNIVSNNYSLGQVSGNSNVGGFVGYISNGILLNNYSLSNVVRSGGTSTYFGGFLGNNDWLVGTKIINCYSSGSVSGEGWNPTNRGFSPYLYEAGVSGLFWDMNTSEQLTNVAGATGKTTTEMKTQSTFTGWDFDNIWAIEEGESYPYLRTNEQTPHPPIIMVASNYTSGTYNLATLNITLESTGDSIYYTTNGTEPSCSGTGTLYSSPITITTGTTTIKAIGCKDGYNSRVTSFTYILPEPNNIMTVEDLNNIRNNLTGFYILGADIDLNVSPYNEGDGWEPIGNDLTKFSGGFDGNGYKIRNLYINKPATDFVGLFGYTNTGAIINDIELENVNLIGNVHVGGLVGANVYGIISNSSSEGSVSGVYNVGGLVGVHSFGIISNSFSTAFVLGQNYVGGFVGLNNNGTISNSYALGEVTRTSGTETFFGGFLGNDTGITNICYSTGRVIYTGSTNPTDRGFSGNTVTGSGNFWDVNTSGQTTSASGATGKTTSEMKTQNTFTGWDFTNIWAIDAGSTYPYLRSITYDVNNPLPQ